MVSVKSSDGTYGEGVVNIGTATSTVQTLAQLCTACNVTIGSGAFCVSIIPDGNDYAVNSSQMSVVVKNALQ
jgi:hypothetical protein